MIKLWTKIKRKKKLNPKDNLKKVKMMSKINKTNQNPAHRKIFNSSKKWRKKKGSLDPFLIAQTIVNGKRKIDYKKIKKCLS